MNPVPAADPHKELHICIQCAVGYMHTCHQIDSCVAVFFL